jgi:hypothetical protein
VAAQAISTAQHQTRPLSRTDIEGPGRVVHEEQSRWSTRLGGLLLTAHQRIAHVAPGRRMANPKLMNKRPDGG